MPGAPTVINGCFSFTGLNDFSVNVTSIGKPITLGVSRVKNCKFEVYGPPNETCEFFWTVYAKRGNVIVEPKKDSVKVNGDGPYRWIS